MPAPVDATVAAQAVELVLRGGLSEREAARATGMSRQTVGRLCERARAAESATSGPAVQTAAPAAPASAAPAVVAPQVEKATPDAPDALDALEAARDGVRRARTIRLGLDARATMAERHLAEKLEREAVALLSRVESSRDLTPAEILRSTAWRRVERVLVEAASGVPGAAKAIGAALARLAQEGG